MKFLFEMRFKRILIVSLLAMWHLGVSAQEAAPLRRPISPEQPMWLIHIDTWNYADPQKIIDLIPDDIKPYAVMNISLSISHDAETSQFQVAEYGYEIAKSWVRTCAQNQMWAIVQLSSGGFAQFSDFDLSVYEEFYREYPNLIGFNYAEQFWGYDDPNDPLSAKWSDRMNHFANLLELSNQYGGYLVVSMCWNQWGPSINPIGQMKRSPAFAEACRNYTENYILCEKYTQQAYNSDMESICLGAYLSGYSGNYGIRYDDTGWTNTKGVNEDFTMATAGAVHLEHVMMTGQTVIDGPELIWTNCFRETNRVSTTDGYTMRNWDTFPQFDNVSIDLFRKILDGTVRIPSREEVIDRTKVVVINDVNVGSDDDIYSTPTTLFQGLYRMDGDGNLRDNKTFFKKTGRYPTIPTVFQLDDALANSFEIQINKSDYSKRWPSISSKLEELNSIFPDEYTGDIYARRSENSWVVYNPYKTGAIASGSIPFKYNTSEKIDLSFSQYTAGVMTEYSDSVVIYLSNYDNELSTSLKTDVITIYGCSEQPEYTWFDRADHRTSIVSEEWLNGVFTLNVRHNGSIELNIKCSGTATDRLTDFKTASLKQPDKPAIYTGPRQYEAECFDFKNVRDVVTQGQRNGIRNYTGQGYIRFGTSSAASIRDTLYAVRTGLYQLSTRYSLTGGDVNTIDLYVNGEKLSTPVFTQTASDSDWNYILQEVQLNEGKNVIVFKANASQSRTVNFDNIVISQGASSYIYHFNGDIATTEATTPPAELISIASGSAGVAAYNENNSFKPYTTGELNETGVANLDMFPAKSINYSVSWKEIYNTAGAEKGLLLRASDANELCSYAEGLKQGYLFTVTNNADKTVTLKTYLATKDGLVSKQSYTSSFTVDEGTACWYRAMALNDSLYFECSNDSINWVGGDETTFVDSTYQSGATQLIWGMNSGSIDWVMDNITYASGNISISRLSLDKITYVQGTGPSNPRSLTIAAASLIDNIEIIAPHGFEISLDAETGYDSLLMIAATEGAVDDTQFFIRLKDELPVASYSGKIYINSKGTQNRVIELEGEVKPQPVSIKYNFSNDVATSSAGTPPAANTSIGEGNTATAGVVSYTDADAFTSNVITPYGGGQRNATGTINLELFPKNSTDYSVTWKQYVGSASANYKVGMLLRGDTTNIGDNATGYVQGMMHGYLFIANTTGTASEFRIYRSTSVLNTLDRLTLTNKSLDPNPGQAMWYRASVSGSDEVALMIEYSTDGITWEIGATASDGGATAFKTGATQIVWGLGVGDTNFYIDDIVYHGLTETSGSLPEVFESSTQILKDFNYTQGFGPSHTQSFTVWGDSLSDDIEVAASSGFEISLDSASSYSSTIVLPVSSDSLKTTRIYVRMIAGLSAKTYNGTVSVASPGVLNQTVKLTGVVDPGPELYSSQTSLTGFSYSMGSGPSALKSALISATRLKKPLILEAPENFELMVQSTEGYQQSVSIEPVDGEVEEIRVRFRLKADLPAGSYKGNALCKSEGAETIEISLRGSVSKKTGVLLYNDGEAEVIDTEYYTITGQRIKQLNHMKGIFIVKKRLADGSTITEKIMIGMQE